ncbi:TPA: baseplate tail-tube junction protein [Aeromonas dhakensis]|nr:baseplate tail-tube junction protein [Aeromonas dhakensis]
MANTSIMQDIKNVVGKFMPDNNVEKKDTGVEVMRHPIAMFDNPSTRKAIPCLAFTFFKTQRFNAQALQRSAESGSTMGFKTEGILMMRMPDNGLNDNLQFDIAGSSDGFMEEFLRGTIGGFQSGGVVGAVKGGVNATVNEVGLRVDKASGAYATNLGSNKTISSNKGVQGFNGVQTRSWTFNWRLTPQTQAELKEIGRIIHFLYKNSTVSVTGSQQNYTTMEVPPMVRFEEKIIGDKDSYLRYTPRLVSGWCHISNVRVSTNGENGYTTFAETAGDATVIDLEVSFKEITLPTSNLFENAAKANMWQSLSIDGSDITEGNK